MMQLCSDGIAHGLCDLLCTCLFVWGFTCAFECFRMDGEGGGYAYGSIKVESSGVSCHMYPVCISAGHTLLE